MGQVSAWDVVQNRALMSEKVEVSKVELEILVRMARGLVGEMDGNLDEALFSYLVAVALSSTARVVGADVSVLGSTNEMASMEIFLADRCQQLRLLLDGYPEQLAAFECRVEATVDMLGVYAAVMTCPAAEVIARGRAA